MPHLGHASAFAVVIAAFCPMRADGDISIRSLGTSPNGDPLLPEAINSDGSVIGARAFGTSTSTTSGDRPGLWTAAGGFQDLYSVFGLGGPYLDAISADGNTIAVSGRVSTTGQSSHHAYTWSVNGGLLEHQPLPGDTEARAFRLNADGTTVLGTSYQSERGYRTVIWHGDGPAEDLGAPPLTPSTGHQDVVPWGLSADGNVAVGWNTPSVAFRWTAPGGFVQLAALPGQWNANAAGVSADGHVAVGFSNSDAGIRAVRWVDAGPAEDLGSMDGASRYFADFSNSDGSVIVGTALWPARGSFETWFWTPATGMIDLRSFLAAAGQDLSSWSLLASPTGIGADGRTIIGSGLYEYAPGDIRNAGWIVTVPGTPTLVLFALTPLAARRKR